jgi:hypothetical protein
LAYHALGSRDGKLRDLCAHIGQQCIALFFRVLTCLRADIFRFSTRFFDDQFALLVTARARFLNQLIGLGAALIDQLLRVAFGVGACLFSGTGIFQTLRDPFTSSFQRADEWPPRQNGEQKEDDPEVEELSE